MIASLKTSTKFDGDPKKFVEDAMASKDVLNMLKAVPVLGEAVRLRLLTKAEATAYINTGVSGLSTTEDKSTLEGAIKTLDKFEALSK